MKWKTTREFSDICILFPEHFQPMRGSVTKLWYYCSTGKGTLFHVEQSSKCVKLHIGNSCNQILCKDLYVDGWKLDVVTDTDTGKLWSVMEVQK